MEGTISYIPQIKPLYLLLAGFKDNHKLSYLTDTVGYIYLPLT